jgi:TonB family protein
MVRSRILNDAGIIGLPMIQPEQKSTETTQYERAREEPLELRDSYQSHQKEAKHDHQTDGMRGPFTSAVPAEWYNFDRVWLSVVQSNLPPVTNLEGFGNHGIHRPKFSVVVGHRLGNIGVILMVLLGTLCRRRCQYREDGPMAHRTPSLHAIVRLIAALALFAVNPPIATSQDKPEKTNEDQKRLIKRCNPVVVKKAKPQGKTIQVREGEKSTGFTPLIAFQIAESGEVINAHVKRSSGIRDIDDSALNSVKSTKYNARPGCPVIDNEADVLIDFR